MMVALGLDGLAWLRARDPLEFAVIQGIASHADEATLAIDKARAARIANGVAAQVARLLR